MNPIRRTVKFTSWTVVKVDRDAFTEEFMARFREIMYDFDTIEEHIEHLGQLYARGLVDNMTKFIEGYGDPKKFGIRFVTEEESVSSEEG